MAYQTSNRTTYSVLLIICIIGFWLFENFYTPAIYSDSNEETNIYSFPQELLPTSTTGIIVNHSYFSLSYNEPFEQAEWVAYVLDKSHLTYDDRERPYFIEDPFVITKSADWKNFKGSGYDRGHLVPAGDRRFSEKAFNETFYTSNISPQDKEFNVGIWHDLEKRIRGWAKKYGALYIITGGVLETGLVKIGEEDVAVPDTFYKIIARKKAGQWTAIAFLIPNKPQIMPLGNFTVTVDEVEHATGINFFNQLPIDQQDNFEKMTTKADWEF